MFFKSKMGYIGVDLGSRCVKLAQVKRNGEKFEIANVALIPRSSAWSFESWQDSSPKSSTVEIKAGLSTGFFGSQSSCASTMALADVRGLSIDWSSDDLLNRSQILSKVAELERFDFSDREFDYWPIKRRFQTGNANTHVLSLPGSWAKRFSLDHDESGLSCRALDGIPTALARATNFCPSVRRAETTAVLDWGYTRATYCLSVDGSPVFVRMLRGCGFDSAVNAVCRRLEINEIEAVSILTKVGLGNRDEEVLPEKKRIQAAVEEAIGPTVDTLISELRRTQTFVAKNYSDGLPSQLVLAGGGSTVRNLGHHLNGLELGKVVPWTFKENQPMVGKYNSLPVSLFASAISLSMLAWVREECEV